MILRKNLDRKQMQVIYNNMIARCYQESYKKNNPSYDGCTVCPEWLDDKETFFEWVAENFYIIPGEQIDLEKDILIHGNKMYSPEACCFAPHRINVYFENLTRESIYSETTGKYRMDIMIDGETTCIGFFDTEEAAKLAYIRHKEAAILTLANKYKGKIPDILYQAMVNYRITLDDWKKKN